MFISVIIPAYNAEKYILQAVESALAQPETGEVVLIEDASPDNALQICQELASTSPKVKLLRHTDKKNHGASASRNLGIRNAKFDYIAFLDADDFYCPERFKVAKENLDKFPEIDGVYEAIGTHFQDEEGKKKWFSIGRENITLTTITERIEPELLLEALLTKKIGWFHADGLVVRKAIFERTGYFDEHLELHEDVFMWVKMSAVGKLLPGRLTEPVSMRRVHRDNRVSASKEKLDYYKLLGAETLLDWAYKNQLASHKLELIFRWCLKKYIHLASQSIPLIRIRIIRRIYKFIVIIKLALRYPLLLRLIFLQYTNRNNHKKRFDSLHR